MALADILGVKVVESNPDRYVLHTVVTKDMLQPHGVLHGGISAYLAEHAASECCTKYSDIEKVHFLGLEVSSTHLLPILEGDTIETVATPLRKGGRIQYWKIEQFRISDGQMFNVSQMTMYAQKQHPKQ